MRKLRFDYPYSGKEGKSISDKILAAFTRATDVEHDEADQIIVEREGRLLGKLRKEAQEPSQDAKHFILPVTSQFLQDVAQKEGRVFHQAGINHLISHVMDGHAIWSQTEIVQQRDDGHDGGAQTRRKQNLGHL